MAEFRFKIDAHYTPETLPMHRLAEYMADVAVILGEQEHVHIVRLEAGSVGILSESTEPADPQALARIASAKRGEGPREPISAMRNINRRLSEDRGTGDLTENTGKRLIHFPGELPPTIKAFNEQGSLDGTIISVGGKNDPVPVHLESVDPSKVIYNCLAKRDLAKELGRYLFGSELRTYGTGRWYRDGEGVWQLDRFLITHVEVLDNAPLTAAISRLRSIAGSEWGELEDPWSELAKIRGDDSDEGGG